MTKKSTFKVGEISDYIVIWLREYAQKAKVEGFVVGISGGIDSAVTSSLCAQTGLKTLCVEMPIHQHISQVNRGKEHIEQLMERFPNVEHAIVDLTPVFETFKNNVPEIENQVGWHGKAPSEEECERFIKAVEEAQ